MPWYKRQIALVAASLGLAFVLAVVLLYPLARQCKPDRAENTHVAHSDSQDHQSPSTHISPFEKVVEAIYQGIQTQYEANEGAKQHKNWWHSFLCEMKITDFAIATFTLWLVVIGAWQGFQLQRTVEATNRAADALPKIERAYLFPQQFSGSVGATTTVQKEGKQATTVGIRVAMDLKNHGRTPAVIQDAIAAIAVCKSFEEATLGTADSVQTLLPRGWVIGSGEIDSANALDFEIDAEKYNRARSDPDVMLVVFGVIRYEDVLNEVRTMEFMREFRGHRGRGFRFPANGEGNRWT